MFGFGFGGMGGRNPRLRMIRAAVLVTVLLSGVVFHSSTTSRDVRDVAEVVLVVVLVLSVVGGGALARRRGRPPVDPAPTAWPYATGSTEPAPPSLPDSATPALAAQCPAEDGPHQVRPVVAGAHAAASGTQPGEADSPPAGGALRSATDAPPGVSDATVQSP